MQIILYYHHRLTHLQHTLRHTLISLPFSLVVASACASAAIEMTEPNQRGAIIGAPIRGLYCENPFSNWLILGRSPERGAAYILRLMVYVLCLHVYYASIQSVGARAVGR